MAEAEAKRAVRKKTRKPTRPTGREAAGTDKTGRAGKAQKSKKARRPEGSPVVWAVGGGKGGVGKSVLTANLGVALARRGRRTVVMDADLGGANLHTLLGVENPKRTLSDFLNRSVDHLEEVLVETPEPMLRLACGSRALIGMANPRHSQKQKLLRQLRSLDVHHVVMDLSAGSAFNVLDFFLEARHPILVVVPEPTSIENAYHFLKSAFFRALTDAARLSPVKAAITRVLEAKSRQRIRSPRELIDAVGELDPSAGESLRQRAKEFQPLLVVNQAGTIQHRRLGHEIREACSTYLGTQIEYLGTLERDESVRVAVGRRRPVMDLFPSCSFSMDLDALAVKLLSRTDADVMPPLLAGRDDELLELEDGSSSTGSCLEDSLAYGRNRPRRTSRPSVVAMSSRPVHENAEKPAAAAPAAKTDPAPAPVARRIVSEESLEPVDLDHPGASLRRRRLELGLELPELERRTRIRHLEHLEDEAFGMLPPEVYVRSYVIQYARALGISEADALATSYLEHYRRTLH